MTRQHCGKSLRKKRGSDREESFKSFSRIKNSRRATCRRSSRSPDADQASRTGARVAVSGYKIGLKLRSGNLLISFRHLNGLPSQNLSLTFCAREPLRSKPDASNWIRSAQFWTGCADRFRPIQARPATGHLQHHPNRCRLRSSSARPRVKASSIFPPH